MGLAGDIFWLKMNKDRLGIISSHFFRNTCKRWAGWLCLATIVFTGCSRSDYRKATDDQTYAIIDENNQDSRWSIDGFDITPDSRSRFYNSEDPDFPPMPPDDPSAHRLMHEVYGMNGWERWHDFGDLAHIENPEWTTHYGGKELDNHPIATIPLKIEQLSLQDSVEWSLIHSRDYQTQLEDVYLAALSLNFRRYQFDVRLSAWTGEPGSDLFFQHQPDDAAELSLSPTTFGLRKLFPAGTQLIAELTNNTLWLFSGPNQTQTTSSFAFSLVQPLFAGAGREVVLEALTQSERNLLYKMRDFARFRKDFFVTIVTGSRAVPLPGSAGGLELSYLIRGERSPAVGYYFLLYFQQRVRNATDNVRALESQVAEVRSLWEAGRASSLDVTQLESSLQRSRSRYMRLQNRFQDEMDRYKLQLGLPPEMEMDLDDTMLSPFQFIDPDLNRVEDRLRSFVSRIGELSRSEEGEVWRSAIEELDKVHMEIEKLFPLIGDDFKQLKKIVPQRRKRRGTQAAEKTEQEMKQDQQVFNRVEGEFLGHLDQWRQLKKAVNSQPLIPARRVELMDQIRPIHEALLQVVRELSVIQLRIRTQLVLLEPVTLDMDEVVRIALANRLDLMNRRGVVVDARRRIELAADAMEATVDLVTEATVNTDPLLENRQPVDFHSDQSEFRVGLSLKTPLDRRREQNNYRSAQIAYARARRNYMAAEDQVKLDVRKHFRSVLMLEENFEIKRRALRIAAFELDQAIEFGKRPGTKGMQQGLNLSRALDNILDVQDDLIDRWVEYETARLQLFRDMGTMKLDERGFWVDDFYQQLDSDKTESTLSLSKGQDPSEELQGAVSSNTDSSR